MGRVFTLFQLLAIYKIYNCYKAKCILQYGSQYRDGMVIITMH